MSGHTGTLVPANDPQALAEAMAIYANDPQMRQQQGENGCGRIAERFSMAQMLAAYGGVYEQLMEQRGNAR